MAQRVRAGGDSRRLHTACPVKLDMAASRAYSDTYLGAGWEMVLTLPKPFNPYGSFRVSLPEGLKLERIDGGKSDCAAGAETSGCLEFRVNLQVDSAHSHMSEVKLVGTGLWQKETKRPIFDDCPGLSLHELPRDCRLGSLGEPLALLRNHWILDGGSGGYDASLQIRHWVEGASIELSLPWSAPESALWQLRAAVSLHAVEYAGFGGSGNEAVENLIESHSKTRQGDELLSLKDARRHIVVNRDRLGVDHSLSFLLEGPADPEVAHLGIVIRFVVQTYDNMVVRNPPLVKSCHDPTLPSLPSPAPPRPSRPTARKPPPPSPPPCPRSPPAVPDPYLHCRRLTLSMRSEPAEGCHISPPPPPSPSPSLPPPAPPHSPTVRPQSSIGVERLLLGTALLVLLLLLVVGAGILGIAIARIRRARGRDSSTRSRRGTLRRCSSRRNSRASMENKRAGRDEVDSDIDSDGNATSEDSESDDEDDEEAEMTRRAGTRRQYRYSKRSCR